MFIQEDFSLSNEIWFRGQSKYCYDLTPKVFRQGGKYEGDILDETGMYHEFQRLYPAKREENKSVTEWLTLMQHYGVPTRLLDWSQSLLVALYFAVTEHQESDGALYALDPEILSPKMTDNYYSQRVIIEKLVESWSISGFVINLVEWCEKTLIGDFKIGSVSRKELQTNDYQRSVLINKIVTTEDFNVLIPIKERDNASLIGFPSQILSTKPAHSNERLILQQGTFTLHGGKYFEGEEKIEILDLEDHSNFKKKDGGLIKLKINQDHKGKLKQELKMSGINKATLFPEMDKRAEWITEEYTTLSISKMLETLGNKTSKK